VQKAKIAAYAVLAAALLGRASQAQSVVPVYQVWNSTPPFQTLAQANPHLASPDTFALDDRVTFNAPCDANVLQQNLPTGYTLTLPCSVGIQIQFDRRLEAPKVSASAGPSTDLNVITTASDASGHVNTVVLANFRNTLDDQVFKTYGQSVTLASVSGSRESGGGSQEIRGEAVPIGGGEPIVMVDAVLPYPGPVIHLIKPVQYLTYTGSLGVWPKYFAQQEDRATLLPTDPGVSISVRIPGGILRLPGFDLPVDAAGVTSVYARYKVNNAVVAK
jgi:hypothetical protein